MSSVTLAQETLDTSVPEVVSTEVSPYLASWRKRGFDIATAVPLYLLSRPVEWAARLYLRAQLDQGPGIYREKRSLAGLKGSEFILKKLRTMYNDGPSDAEQNFSRRNSRVAGKVAQVVRKLRIDEAPQFRQIIKGNMAMVGPRAIRADHQAQHDKLLLLSPDIPPTRELLTPRMVAGIGRRAIRTGLTGPGQLLAGWYDGDEVTAENVAKLTEANNEYLRNANLWRDVRIFGRTLGIVVVSGIKCAIEAMRQRQLQVASVDPIIPVHRPDEGELYFQTMSKIANDEVA